MILWYAMGGGLGHLTRTLALAHTLGLPFEEIQVISAQTPPENYPVKVISPPSELESSPEAFGNWLRELVAKVQPEKIMVDAFPAGILGELRPGTFGEVPCELVARNLKWQVYKERIRQELPEYQKIWQVETLDVEYAQNLRGPLSKIEIHYPEMELPWQLSNLENYPDSWLIVHSGPPEEVEILLDEVQERARLFCGQNPIFICGEVPEGNLPSNVEVLGPVWPVWPAFEFAERIFSAAGFNSIQLSKTKPHKHTHIPFHRRLDDQFGRAREFKKQSQPDWG